MVLAGSPAVKEKTPETRLLDLINQKEEDFIQGLKPLAGGESASFDGLGSSNIGSGGQGIATSGNFLKTAGDTMIGPIAFFPVFGSISGGILDVSKGAGLFSGKVTIFTGGETNISTIKGAEFAGQKLTIEVVGFQTITFDALGNVQPPNGVSFSMTGNNGIPQSVELQFDIVSGRWLFVDVAIWNDLNNLIGAGGSGDNLGNHIATQNLFMSLKDILNVKNIDFDNGAASAISGLAAIGFFPLNTNIAAVNTVGLFYTTNINDDHKFFEGATEIIRFGQNIINALNHKIENVQSIKFTDDRFMQNDNTLGGLDIVVNDTEDLWLFQKSSTIAKFGDNIDFFKPFDLNNNVVFGLSNLSFTGGSLISEILFFMTTNGFAFFGSGGKVAEFRDEFGAQTFKMDSSARLDFNNSSTFASSGTRTLPSNPAGFINVRVGGANVKIPYYL